MVFGRDTSRLVTSGVYRFSRNPQYTFYALFLLGYAMMGRSVMAYVAVALFCVILHFMIRIEEERIAAQKEIAGMQAGVKAANDKATLAAKQQSEGLRIGADDYLGKPFSFSELHLRLENLLGRRAGRPVG